VQLIFLIVGGTKIDILSSMVIYMSRQLELEYE